VPLKAGKSRKTIQANIREMVHSYERTGKIGNVRPKSRKQAIKIAVATALNKAKQGGRRKKR